MKKIIYTATMLLSTLAFSQVGINTETPSATLDIVGKGNTFETKALEVNNSSNTEMLTVLNNGNVGINVNSPTTKLHTDGLLRFENLPTNNANVNFLTTDSNGNVAIRQGSSFAPSVLAGANNTDAFTGIITATNSAPVDLYVSPFFTLSKKSMITINTNIYAGSIYNGDGTTITDTRNRIIGYTVYFKSAAAGSGYTTGEALYYDTFNWRQKASTGDDQFGNFLSGGKSILLPAGTYQIGVRTYIRNYSTDTTQVDYRGENNSRVDIIAFPME